MKNRIDKILNFLAYAILGITWLCVGLLVGIGIFLVILIGAEILSKPSLFLPIAQFVFLIAIVATACGVVIWAENRVRKWGVNGSTEN